MITTKCKMFNVTSMLTVFNLFGLSVIFIAFGCDRQLPHDTDDD